MAVVRVIQVKEDGSGDFPALFLRLAERISAIVCDEHSTSASLMTIFRDKAGISGCCDSLLDRVEREVNAT